MARVINYIRSRFSPRPWGCSGAVEVAAVPAIVFPTPVGMFRIRELFVARYRSFPHARGDVPMGERSFNAEIMFSPRPWGCSVAGRACRVRDCVFPTPVGMFRLVIGDGVGDVGFPHARGDVPGNKGETTCLQGFSPRPWGCSVNGLGEITLSTVFPTPVGMFRRRGRRGRHRLGFPHARGDVPRVTAQASASTRFSPRPWGCSEVLDRAGILD